MRADQRAAGDELDEERVHDSMVDPFCHQFK
jgi:hypothetical protein